MTALDGQVLRRLGQPGEGRRTLTNEGRLGYSDVVAAWRGLPVVLTAGIVAMVRAAGRAQDGD